VMTHAQPTSMSGFLKSYAGGAPVSDGADGLTLRLDASSLSVWTPDAARRRLTDDPALFNPREGQMAAIVFNVANLARTQLTLLANNVPHRMEGAQLIVPSGAAFGTLLIFTEDAS
jgi:hypothetical protein